MQNSNPFPSFQPDRTDNFAEELYPDIFSATSPPTQPESAPLSELDSTRSVLYDMTGEVPWIVETEQLAVPPRTTRNRSNSQSLTAALRSTILRPKREPVVIPGAKKRQRNTGRASQMRAERHFNPLLRLSILLTITLLILLATLLFPLIIRQ